MMYIIFEIQWKEKDLSGLSTLCLLCEYHMQMWTMVFRSNFQPTFRLVNSYFAPQPPASPFRQPNPRHSKCLLSIPLRLQDTGLVPVTLRACQGN